MAYGPIKITKKYGREGPQALTKNLHNIQEVGRKAGRPIPIAHKEPKTAIQNELNALTKVCANPGKACDLQPKTYQ